MSVLQQGGLDMDSERDGWGSQFVISLLGAAASWALVAFKGRRFEFDVHGR